MPLYDIHKLREDGSYTVYNEFYGASPHISRECDDKLVVSDLYDWHASRAMSEPDYKLVRVEDEAWRARETERFRKGTYMALPWDLEPIADHYAHVSLVDGAQIAFTPDEAKGKLDRQTRMKPGRYLAKFYPELTGDEVRALALSVDKATEVKFATSADDIEKVYLNGPNSCMSHGLSSYQSSVHPVRVYGDSDLKLAYLSSTDLTQGNFRASARALVWEAKMVYVRTYGDTQRMGEALEALGYSEGSFEGAKIARIEDDNSDCLVVPYLDDCHTARDCGSHLVIDSDGGVDCETTTGLAKDERNFCEYYEHRTNDDISYVTDVCQYWSETAIARHAFYCYGYDQYYSDDHGCHEVDGENYSEAYLGRHGFYCPRSEAWFLKFNEDRVTLKDTGEIVSETWAVENAHLDDNGYYYAEEPPVVSEETPEVQLELSLDSEAPTAAESVPPVVVGLPEVAGLPEASQGGLRVVVIDNLWPQWITDGREYEVLDSSSRQYYHIVRNDGRTDGFPRSYFRIVQDIQLAA